jgi:hypothetical protein
MSKLFNWANIISLVIMTLKLQAANERVKELESEKLTRGEEAINILAKANKILSEKPDIASIPVV